MLRSTLTWLAILLLLGFMACTLGSCATVGREFPTERVSDIELQGTTRAEIQEMFGPPWRTGIEDGYETWTYGRYRYAIFSDAKTKDLVVRFNDQGVVRSYTFNTTEHDLKGE